MTGKHLLDFLLNAQHETPFWIICAAFGLIGIALICLGAWMDVSDQQSAEAQGE